MERSKHLTEDAEHLCPASLYSLHALVQDFLTMLHSHPFGSVTEILCHMLQICDLPFHFPESYILGCFAS